MQPPLPSPSPVLPADKPHISFKKITDEMNHVYKACCFTVPYTEYFLIQSGLCTAFCGSVKA